MNIIDELEKECPECGCKDKDNGWCRNCGCPVIVD